LKECFPLFFPLSNGRIAGSLGAGLGGRSFGEA